MEIIFFCSCTEFSIKAWRDRNNRIGSLRRRLTNIFVASKIPLGGRHVCNTLENTPSWTAYQTPCLFCCCGCFTQLNPFYWTLFFNNPWDVGWRWVHLQLDGWDHVSLEDFDFWNDSKRPPNRLSLKKNIDMWTETWKNIISQLSYYIIYTFGYIGQVWVAGSNDPKWLAFHSTKGVSLFQLRGFVSPIETRVLSL